MSHAVFGRRTSETVNSIIKKKRKRERKKKMR
jgi:hypothetical protein